MAPERRGPEWSRPHIVQLPKFSDHRGSLTFIEGENHVPFPIRRIYYLYEVVKETVRGEHAHRDLEQLIVAVSGSFDVVVDDGARRRTFSLNACDEGLYLPPLHWRTLNNFSGGAVCMVLASLPYDPDDYLTTYDAFLAEVRRVRGVGGEARP
ncbi:MAG: WxcM-like domain-containing protein [Nitrospirae bacterium]|nr:MAG: WxcM-like domain-containing protein [Nitrospirota bacterium]